MRSPDHTRISQLLPAVYADDEVSFAQLDAYLGLLDSLDHAVVERLEDLAAAVGPDAALRWPAELPLDAGRDAVLADRLATFEAAADWSAFVFPASWSRDETGLDQRRRYLAASARLWRRRGTPRGFLDWFCLAFRVEAADRPYLLEHFKVADTTIPEPELTGTLFVPSTAQFSDYRRRREAIEFVDWYAPSHVALRVCWTRPGFAPPSPPAPPDDGASPTEVADFWDDVQTYRADLRALLCSITSFVDHANGIRIWECIDAGRSIDRLDVGQLPTDD